MKLKLCAFLAKSLLLRGDDDDFVEVPMEVPMSSPHSESRLTLVTDRWCLGRTHKKYI
jgi:hypothetical protein